MSKEEIDDMIVENRALVNKVMKDMRCHWDTRDEYREMHDAGVMGLIKGAQSYNKSISKPSTYLYTCIKHEICKYIYLKERAKRKIDKWSTISLDEPYCYEDGKSVEEMVPDERVDVERGVMEEVTKDMVRRTLDKLNPRYKELLTLRYGVGCDEYKVNEIAKMQGSTRVNVSNKIRLARIQFKKHYLKLMEKEGL